MTKQFFQGSTNYPQLLNFEDENGNLISTATVTFQILDSGSNVLDSGSMPYVGNVTLGGITYTAYQGTTQYFVSGGTIGDHYTLKITATLASVTVVFSDDAVLTTNSGGTCA